MTAKKQWTLEDIDCVLPAACFEKGKLKRRVAVALLAAATRELPPLVIVDIHGKPVGTIAWGRIIADGACYEDTQAVASAAYEGRQFVQVRRRVPISD